MAYLAAQPRPSTSSASDGSRTVTLLDSQPLPEDSESNPDGVVGVLQLRGAPRNRQRVAWGEDVVDNEGCGKKSSKICCIYHKPKRFDESSDSDSSDSDSDSCDHGSSGHSHRHLDRAQPSRGGDRDGGMQSSRSTDGATELQKPSEPNAYERPPKPTGKRNGGA